MLPSAALRGFGAEDHAGCREPTKLCPVERGFNRSFRLGKLRLGLNVPIERYVDSVVPNMAGAGSARRRPWLCRFVVVRCAVQRAQFWRRGAGV